MTKSVERQIKALIEESANIYNPYKNRSTIFYVGNEKKFLYNNTSYTEDELHDAYVKTAFKDACCGYNDRFVGYYDKWYRYNHADEGRAYDIGVKIAASDNRCVTEMQIIPA